MPTTRTEWNLGVDRAIDCGDVPDLQTQLETLLAAVWESERWARTEDRIDTAVRYTRRLS
jgi:hypothetical protein